jgi:hypothetical protein
MALELQYYGQNVSLFGPDVALTGDPSVDIAAVQAAGFNPGMLVKLGTSSNNPDGVALQLASDGEAIFGTIITDAGEFANTIGVSGSNRISVARGLWVGNLYGSGYVAVSGTNTYAVGAKVYCGQGTGHADGVGELASVGDDGAENGLTVRSELEGDAIRVVGRGSELDEHAGVEASSLNSSDVHRGIASQGNVRSEQGHVLSVVLKFKCHIRLL